MQLKVQGKQMDVGDALREHINEKLETINGKYFGRATDADVTMTPEGSSAFKTHIIVHVGKNIHVVGTAIEHDPYQSFDHAAERVAKQLRRYKKRLRDHHERVEETPETALTHARDYVIKTLEDHEIEEEDVETGAEDGDDPVIVAELTRPIETLSVSDAVMKLDLSGETAMLFRNAKHDELNMVYRRPDGNIGWVDPSETAASKA